MAKPILKWVGGKTQLLESLRAALPERIEGTYYEAFMGGGALFFHLSGEGFIERAVLNDWNPELINLYTVVRDKPDDLSYALHNYSSEYANELIDFASEEAYYATRLLDPAKLDPVARAGRTIYLNKTGFNGLYRLNKKGQFNVPWGKRKKLPMLVEAENFRACHEALQKARLTTGDFEAAVAQAVAGDVVYFDPPYVPASATSSFTSYTSDGFTLNDQKRLVALCLTLMRRGVHVVASNADTPLVRELYDAPEFEIRAVPARRSINAKGDKRGPVGEVIIVGKPAYEFGTADLDRRFPLTPRQGIEDEEEEWSEGDPDSMNEADAVAQLSELEEQLYAPYLKIIRRYARDLDDWGDDLRSKVSHRFEEAERGLLSRILSAEEMAVLDAGWYGLSGDTRFRLTHSVD